MNHSLRVNTMGKSRLWKRAGESTCDQSLFCTDLGFIIKICHYIYSVRGEEDSPFFSCIDSEFSDVPLFQARSYNKQMRPAILDHCSGNKWTNTSHHPEFLVGEEVGDLFTVKWKKKTEVLFIKSVCFATQFWLFPSIL